MSRRWRAIGEGRQTQFANEYVECRRDTDIKNTTLETIRFIQQPLIATKFAYFQHRIYNLHILFFLLLRFCLIFSSNYTTTVLQYI
jgi:hypothetical protein